MKAKFGDSLRSKADAAMVKEALCKVLCHNLCCLVASTHELAVEATCWEDEIVVIAGHNEATSNDIEAWGWI